MKLRFKLLNLQLFATDKTPEEQIKELQDKNKELEERNKTLEEENKSLKAKNEEQASSVKGLKDDLEKFKGEVKEMLVNTHKEENSQDNKQQGLFEELVSTYKK